MPGAAPPEIPALSGPFPVNPWLCRAVPVQFIAGHVCGVDGERDLKASALANPTASSYLLPLLQELHGNGLKLCKLAAKCFS